MEEIASLRANLRGALDQVLDLEAGLADARLPDLQTTLTQILDTTLDLDAGRAQILPSPPKSTTASTRVFKGLLRLTLDLNRRTLHEKLIARTSFPFREMIYLQSIAELAHKKLLMLRVPVSELERAQEHALILSQSENPFARDLAIKLSIAIARLDRRSGGASPHSMLQLAISLTSCLVRDKEIRRALNEEAVLLSDPGTLKRTIAMLIDAVSNVAGADLRGVDLSGIPLEGLRWSERTQWPGDWEFYARENSVEVEPGLFEIRFGSVDAIV